MPAVVEVANRHRARPRPLAPVDRWRLGIATFAVAVFALASVVVVRAIHGSGWVALAELLVGLVLTPVVAAVLEWYVHRLVYHSPVVPGLRKIFVVHTAHHFAYFPTWRYVTAGPPRRLSIRRGSPEAHSSKMRNAGVRLAHFTWYLVIGALIIWLPAWFATRSLPFLVGLVIASVILSNLFIVVHDTIHRPGSHRFVEAQPWFEFLDRHHYIHHVDLGANLNFLLPLGDLLFGTLRTSMSRSELDEHGSLEQAKAAVVGAGERAVSAVAAIG